MQEGSWLLTPDIIDSILSKFIINLPKEQFKLDRLIYHTQLAFYYCYDNKLFKKVKRQIRGEYERQKYHRKNLCHQLYDHNLSQQIINRILDQNQSFPETERGSYIFQKIQNTNYPIYGIIIYREIVKQQQDELDTFTKGEENMLKTRAPQKLEQFNKKIRTKLQFFMVQCKNTGRYGFSKGKIDEGEEPQNCAQRQVLEQTGYQIFIEQDSKYIKVNEFYLFFVANDSTLKLVQKPYEDLEEGSLQLYNRNKRYYQIRPESTGWYDIEKLRDKLTHRCKDAYGEFSKERIAEKQQLKKQLQKQLEKIKEQKQKQQLEKKRSIKKQYKQKNANPLEGQEKRLQYRTKSKSKSLKRKWKQKSPKKESAGKSPAIKSSKNPEIESSKKKTEMNSSKNPKRESKKKNLLPSNDMILIYGLANTSQQFIKCRRQLLMYYLNVSVIILISLFLPSLTIDLWLKKQNIYIANSSFYYFKINIEQNGQQLIPCSITFNHMVANSLATTNQYFDYFTYMSPTDLICYQSAIGNQSYLFPCPFLFNNDSNIRISEITNENEETKKIIKEVDKASYFFVVDNTQFPFPEGAFSYSHIDIGLTTYINFDLDSAYQTMGVRLIYINITIILIYGFSLGVLVYKNTKTEKKMILSEINNRDSIENKAKEEQQQSDIDNYEVIQNELTNRNSKDMPSMISSSQDAHSPNYYEVIDKKK